ncbi:SDR family NAD(P)-dependent oxidoreductase [Sphingomonas sp. 2R-10]|uniref:SDR family NAD(P)-dependent oxidoreductase n=1 Tax=Sphingomonas sp. 2R-10 TaxID=3045148 RepID=UPI000F772D9A|nr:SDR family NAD(P)-dependent oxidoreductase [Sphingomonas sp. 2R-10]MDJ0276341.1 SDR family NAD(P)-dependent oxidoreductase [Sphingomonas sp. 2R-10]
MAHILLTGGSRGIGAAIADRLRGPHAVAVQATRGDLAADFADPGAPTDLWARALDRLDGRIDVLINNAGVFEAHDLSLPHDQWVAGWERTMRINLTAAAELSRLAVLHWQATGRPGRIVNIASRAAHRGDSPAHWHYAASKAGMVAMTKTIARAHAAEGILAFAICPGFVATAMADTAGPATAQADIPLGRVAAVDEVATVAAFCATEAPESMTGAVLDINGASYVR